jgi:hypothetical protein
VGILEFKRLGRTDVMVSAIGMGTWAVSVLMIACIIYEF